MNSTLRVSVALAPTLVFTLVLAEILHSRFGISGALSGALLLYTTLNTLLPSLVLRMPFAVDPIVEGYVNPEDKEIGRAHVCTPVTNAHLVFRLLLEKQNTTPHTCEARSQHTVAAARLPAHDRPLR